MSASVALVEPGHDKLGNIKRQIITGYDRTLKAGTEWIEGSLMIGAALRQGRRAISSDISFGQWLKREKLDFFSHHDRNALVKLAADLDLMRMVLTETESRSYQRIWGANKDRFTSASKPRQSKRKRRDPNFARGTIHRTMKLGEETMAKIKGTSLDSADEQEELIKLNRGADPGTLKPEVNQLVEDAAAGKDVSALATAAKILGRNIVPTLIAAWKKRMVASWQQADLKTRTELIGYLVHNIELPHRGRVIEDLMDTYCKETGHQEARAHE